LAVRQKYERNDLFIDFRNCLIYINDLNINTL
jgi:hypothetical protein